MDRRRRTAGVAGGILATAVTLFLPQSVLAERMDCDRDDDNAKQPADSRCEPRQEPKLRVEPYDDVGESRVPPRSPDLGAAFNPLSPSIGPGSGKLGPEAGRGVLQPDSDRGRGKVPTRKPGPR